MTPETLDVGVDANTSSGRAEVVVGIKGVSIGSANRPPLFVPRDEIGFWTHAWQSGEAESAQERAAGRLRSFDTGTDLLDWLDAPGD